MFSNWITATRLKLAALFRRRALDRDLDDELQFHLAMREQKLIAGGLPATEAHYAARRTLGNATRTRETARSLWTFTSLESWWQDLRFAARMLRKNPGFTAVAILTLALGIGVNTAIFSAVNGILLERLPYADSSRLITIERENVGYGTTPFERSEILEHCNSIERLAAYRHEFDVIQVGDLLVQRWSSFVSSDFFPMLGVSPLLGRSILPQDTKPGNDHVAVLSYRFWTDIFGGDANIAGRTIYVKDRPYTVVGVMPRDFEFGVLWWSESDEGLWLPLVPPHSPDRQDRGEFGNIIGRLKKSATLAEARAQLQILSPRFAARLPMQLPGKQLRAESLIRRVEPRLRSALLILLGAVAVVLLMACVNLSALLVARARTREKEIAIRKTLGASRLRIIRQLLSESMLLAVAGGALGLLFAIWFIRALRAIAPPQTPRVDRLALSSSVLWFTTAISLFAAIFFGFAPALQASLRSLGGALKGSSVGSLASAGTRMPHSLRSSLVVAEVSLAVVLVIGGALMVRSFEKLVHVDTGVRTDHVLMMYMHFSPEACADEAKQQCALAFNNVLEGIQSLPGIQHAAVSSGGVLTGGYLTRGGVSIVGENGDLNSVRVDLVGTEIASEYFRTLGMRLLQGRDLTENDAAGGPAVAVVNQSFARKYVPGDPLGKRFKIWDDMGGEYVAHTYEIVGVVNDVHDHAVNDLGPPPSYYMPFHPEYNRGEFIARTSADPLAMAAAIERIIQSVDKHAVISNPEALDQIVADSSAEPRFQAVLLGSFGALGLLLAVIGIYGVLSYSVAQRTYEIGVRMALGAQSRDVARLVIVEGGRLVCVGLVLGLAGAWGLTRVLRNLLFEIAPTDPATYLGVAILLSLVALLASYIPARRATRVDPMVALRNE